eukprot:2041704-Alexandrium_andersonii.AAC.1
MSFSTSKPRMTFRRLVAFLHAGWANLRTRTETITRPTPRPQEVCEYSPQSCPTTRHCSPTLSWNCPRFQTPRSPTNEARLPHPEQRPPLPRRLETRQRRHRRLTLAAASEF